MNTARYLMPLQLVVVWTVLIVAQETRAAEPVPSWIGGPRPAADRPTYFRGEVPVNQPATSVRLIAAGNAAGIDLYLDGKLVFELDPYDPLVKLDLTPEFTRGKHLIAVSCRHAGPGATFFVRVRLKFADGTQSTVATDNSWLCSAQFAPDWTGRDFKTDGWSESVARSAVDERLLIPDERRIDLAATDNYEQWRQASGATEGPNPARFSIVPGFQIDLVRSAAAGEDSWISLIFDSLGRALISQEQRGLLRMTLARDGSSVLNVERINDNLQEVRGMAFIGRDLYVNANNSKGMYRLRGDAEGSLGQPELLFTTEGGVGHGRNDLALGPDDKIYSIHGDDIRILPTSTDYTLAAGELRPEKSPGMGHLIRFDPATHKIDTLACGLRNPYGIALNPDGEMFTYDADAEYDMGSPWYRPTRVNHLTLASDFGWRAVTGQWPPYFPDHPDNAAPNLEIGKGSPTAVEFGTRSNFPPRYREALFILDWAYGRILAVHCLPHGASYLCEAETFVKGRPLNVTDLDFAPDGSMYIITGGRKTQSALYRIRFTGERHDTDISRAASAPNDRSTVEARQRLRQLQGLFSQTTLTSDEFDMLWQSLGRADPRIRYAARVALEKQSVLLWEGRAIREQDPLTALTALSGLVRRHDAVRQARVLTRLNEIDLTNATRGERQLAAWIYRRCVTDGATLEPSLADAVRNRLAKLYPDRNYLVNEQLSLALAELGAREFVEETMRLMNDASEQRQQMHYLFVLRNISEGWTQAARQDYFETLAQARHYVGGEGMPGFLDRICSEALAAVTDEAEQAQFAALLARDPSKEHEPAMPRSFVRKWTVGDALSATQSLTDKPDLKRGRALFAAASCSKCHRMADVGAPVGPDLTSVSSRFSRQDILESIMEPSKSIADNYRSLQIVTLDGRTYVGRPVLGGDFRSQMLRLAIDPQHPFQINEIDKRTIEHEQISAVSWMPEGLLETLSAEEIRDLIAFLESGGRSD